MSPTRHADLMPETNGIAAQNWLRSVSQMLGIGVMVLSPDQHILFVNDKALELLDMPDMQVASGMAVDSLVMKMAARGDFGDVDPASFVQKYTSNLRDFSQGNDIQTFRTTIYPPTGRTIQISRVRSGDKVVIATFQDVTVASQTDDIFNIALELGKSGYWQYNFASKTFSIHSQYLESLMSPAEKSRLNQEGFWAVIHPDDVEEARVEWAQSVKRRIKFDKVLRIKTEMGGVRWFKLHARPQDASGTRLTSFICFFEDITDELQLQDELRKAKNQAEKTLQSQNHFLARLGHEIRTPMNAVVGITDALVQYQPNSDITPKLELIQSSAENIMNILEGTLNKSKLDSDKLILDPKPANPGNTVESICQLWEQQALKNGVKIRCHIDAKTPKEIIFDRFRYEQCLNNLLSNAVKFAPNGKVDVIMTVVGQEKNKPQLVLAVRDNGIGMTRKQQNRIFEAYTQADKSISARFGGTGLGMSITKQIIELMGGGISVKSEIGQGTVFALKLPIQVEQETVEEPISAETAIMDHLFEEAKPEETPYSNLRVLVADDNQTNHMVIESLLDSVVGSIETAYNGREVIEHLEADEFDLVLMDIHMPVMDGIEATLAIRGSNKPWSNIAIIAVTADPQYQQLRICKNIGMDESLAKPIKLDGILEAIDRVIEMGRLGQAPQEALRKVG